MVIAERLSTMRTESPAGTNGQTSTASGSEPTPSVRSPWVLAIICAEGTGATVVVHGAGTIDPPDHINVFAVTVPAGTYDAYKVEITSADGGADRMTVWITKDSKVVKLVNVLAQMGGATLTAELLP